MTKKQANEIERILREGGYTKPNGEKRKEDCQYLGRDERYCNLTTQPSCANCRFYAPTTAAKLWMLMEEIVRHEGEEARKDKIIYERNKMILHLNQEIGQIEDELDETIARYELKMRRAEMVKEFIRRWWHG